MFGLYFYNAVFQDMLMFKNNLGRQHYKNINQTLHITIFWKTTLYKH
jgi:hypothetical protein